MLGRLFYELIKFLRWDDLWPRSSPHNIVPFQVHLKSRYLRYLRIRVWGRLLYELIKFMSWNDLWPRSSPHNIVPFQVHLKSRYLRIRGLGRLMSWYNLLWWDDLWPRSSKWWAIQKITLAKLSLNWKQKEELFKGSLYFHRLHNFNSINLLFHSSCQPENHYLCLHIYTKILGINQQNIYKLLLLFFSISLTSFFCGFFSNGNDHERIIFFPPWRYHLSALLVRLSLWLSVLPFNPRSVYYLSLSLGDYGRTLRSPSPYVKGGPRPPALGRLASRFTTPRKNPQGRMNLGVVVRQLTVSHPRARWIVTAVFGWVLFCQRL